MGGETSKALEFLAGFAENFKPWCGQRRGGGDAPDAAPSDRGRILKLPPRSAASGRRFRSWKAPPTRSLERLLRYVARPFHRAGSGGFPVGGTFTMRSRCAEPDKSSVDGVDSDL